MHFSEKKELARLLRVYQNNLLMLDDENARERMSKKTCWNKYIGVKAQYNHARCIANALELEIEKEIMT